MTKVNFLDRETDSGASTQQEILKLGEHEKDVTSEASLEAIETTTERGNQIEKTTSTTSNEEGPKQFLPEDNNVAGLRPRDETIEVNDKSQDQQHQTYQRQQAVVKWSQSESHILLKVYLRDVVDFDVSIPASRRSLIFFARTKSAPNDWQDHRFILNFHSNVNSKCNYYQLSKYILISLHKHPDPSDLWPTLTDSKSCDPDWVIHKPVKGGLITDTHDEKTLEVNRAKESYQATRRKALSEDSGSDDDTFLQGDRFTRELDRLILNFSRDSADKPTFGDKEIGATHQPHVNLTKKQTERSFNKPIDLEKAFEHLTRSRVDIFDPFNRRLSNKTKDNMKYDYRKEATTVDTGKNTVRQALDYKKTYLFLYNLLMFVVFLMVYLVLVIKGLSGTIDDDSVKGAALIVKILVYTQLLETVHPMLGLVPGGPFMPFMQTIGRLLVNHFLSEPEIRGNAAPFAHYLFIVWSSIEIFRYSFYALRVFKVNIYPLTWCRYSLFIPLYPMGGFCESMVVFATIRYYEKTGSYSISLPNRANFSFNLPVALRIYVVCLLFPAIYVLMKYMWSQRSKQLTKEKIA